MKVGSDTIKCITNPKKAEMPFRGIKSADSGELRILNSNKHIAKSADSGIMKTDKQFGKKVGKHAIDWGLNPSSAEDRKALENIIDDIY